MRANPDGGFVGYAFKDYRLTARAFWRRFEGPSWRDDHFMVTRTLKAEAKSLYAEVRGKVRLSGQSLKKIEKAAPPSR